MGLGTRFDPGVIGTPLSVVGGLLDELVGALAKSAKGCEGDGLEADVQVLVKNRPMWSVGSKSLRPLRPPLFS